MQYTIKGKVIKGDGYGRKIGFPTVNLGSSNTEALPPYGIYSGIVNLSGKKYKAGIVIGPLNKKNLPKIEAHLIGYDGDAYGKQVSLQIKKFLRKYKKFKTEKELIAQIKKDLKKCLQA
jgi:FAD synthase